MEPSGDVHLHHTLPHDTSGPGEARNVIGFASAGLPDSLVDKAQLLVSELVSNSVRHSAPRHGADIGLSVTVEDGRLHVEVEDSGGPGAIDVPGSVRGGHGLWFVEQLAADWGVRATPTGRTVWFDLDGA